MISRAQLLKITAYSWLLVLGRITQRESGTNKFASSNCWYPFTRFASHDRLRQPSLSSNTVDAIDSELHHASTVVVCARTRLVILWYAHYLSKYQLHTDEIASFEMVLRYLIVTLPLLFPLPHFMRSMRISHTRKFGKGIYYRCYHFSNLCKIYSSR